MPWPGQTIRGLPITDHHRLDEPSSLEPRDRAEQCAQPDVPIERSDVIEDPNGEAWTAGERDQDPHRRFAEPSEPDVGPVTHR